MIAKFVACCGYLSGGLVAQQFECQSKTVNDQLVANVVSKAVKTTAL